MNMQLEKKYLNLPVKSEAEKQHRSFAAAVSQVVQFVTFLHHYIFLGARELLCLFFMLYNCVPLSKAIL